MNPIILWNWLKKNISLSLLLMATTCLALTLGDIVRSATWSLVVPLALAAALCGWWAGKSRLNGRQATAWIAALGIPGLLFYVTGLAASLRDLVVAAFYVIPQSILWLNDRTPVDLNLLISTGSDLTQRGSAVLSRLAEWTGALAAGKTVTDPVMTSLAWCILLWLIGTWSGWHLRRNHQALRALAPGALLFAVVLDYTRNSIDPLILYLTILLVLLGISRYEDLHRGWQRRGVDYSESIAPDSALVVIPLTLLLVGLAAITPSLSWRDLVERVRDANQDADGHVAESLGLQASNAATADEYRSHGLPRRHLLGMPPEQLQELVMTVRTGELPPMPNEHIEVSVNRYYWRYLTYDVYTGAGWSSSQALNSSLPADASLMELPSGYRVIHQQVHLASEQNERVFWAGTLARSDADIEIAWRISPPPNPSPARNGDILGALTNINEYGVVSLLPQASAAQLRAAGSDYPAEVASRYLHLPESVPERVLALARELTGTAPTPYDRALAIETYLRTFPYTLEVEQPSPGQDVVDYFLFTSQKGYCDYYASAMVVLARAAGLPARIVVGYASGAYNMSSAQYEVREMDAHSWAEIYFPGIGWVEFEPTASQPEIPRTGSDSASPLDLDPAPEQSATARLKERWLSLVASVSGHALLAVAGLAALFAVWQAGEIWFLWFASNARVIRMLYTRLEKNAAHIIPNLARGHTPHELQSALAGRLEKIKNRMLGSMLRPASGEVGQIVSLYEAQVFSEHDPLRSQVRDCIKAWGRLRWRLRITRLSTVRIHQAKVTDARRLRKK